MVMVTDSAPQVATHGGLPRREAAVGAAVYNRDDRPVLPGSAAFIGALSDGGPE